MKFHDIEQNSDEWIALRLGRATSSNFAKIAANKGKAFGDPAKEYAIKIALESIYGSSIGESYTNEWMERGTELEPVARMVYEERTFTEVSNGGFCIHDSFDGVGGSPDGLLLNDNGGIEIKCPKFTTHYNTLRKGKFDSSYKWQMLGNIWICGLDYMDFVSYCPEFPESKQLFIDRLSAEDYKEDLEYLSERMAEFIELVSDTREFLEA